MGSLCSPGAPVTSSTQSATSSIPALMEPYASRLLSGAEAASNVPYTPYGGTRLAGFNPNQTATQAATMGLAQPGQLGQASALLGGQNVPGAFAPGQSTLGGAVAGAQGLNIPGAYGAGQGTLGAAQAGYQGMNVPGAFAPAQTGLAGAQAGAQGLNIPGAFAPGQGTLGGAVAGTQGIQQPGQFGTATNSTLGAMGSSWLAPGAAAAYMNPYQQNVTDIAKREAQRQSDIQATKDAAQFAQAGAFGGSRQGVVEAERQRNLAQQQQDIQSQGANQAYQSGMGQYNAELARQMTGAGQLAGIGGQQLQGQLAQQQALAGMAGQQLGAAGQLTQAQLAQQQALAGMAGQQAGVAGQVTQADLARLQGIAGVGAQQLGAAGQLTGQQLAQQQALAGMGAQQAGMAGQQLTAQQAQAAGLSGLAAQQQGLDLSRLGAQGGVGQQQQALSQQQQDIAYQDFLNQRDYLKNQATFMTGVLHGQPSAQQTGQTTATAPPSAMGQLAGLGITGLGLYNALK